MPTGPPARRETPVRSIVLIVLLGLVVVAGAGFGAKQLLSGNDNSNTPAPNRVIAPNGDGQASSGGNGSSSGAKQSSKAPAAPPRADRTVMVYNGTATPNLAANMKDQLVTAGYADGKVAAADDPNGRGVTTSAVFYKRGAGTQARDVARVLGISSAQVKPIDAALQQSAPDKSVVVEIGADKSGD
jgi:hypothetical protein